MFCPACGAPITPGLSYCNRCGTSLKERSETAVVKTGAIIAFLFAITAIALGGLGIMLGGAIALKKEAGVTDDLVGLFMVMTCAMLALIEIFLVRQLSRVSGRSDQKRNAAAALPMPMQNELQPGSARRLPEPMPSVTENTTRTLEYSRNEPQR